MKKQHAVLERFVSFVNHFCFELEPDWDDPLEPLRLSDECDRERLFLRPPEEDLERLLFWPLSGDDEGERDFFFGETEPFPDLELDLELDLERDRDLELDELLDRDLQKTDINKNRTPQISNFSIKKTEPLMTR